MSAGEMIDQLDIVLMGGKLSFEVFQDAIRGHGFYFGMYEDGAALSQTGPQDHKRQHHAANLHFTTLPGTGPMSKPISRFLTFLSAIHIMASGYYGIMLSI